MRAQRLHGRPEFPHGLEHVWQWFGELDSTRQSGMAANPITYTEIDAWDRLTRRGASEFEVSCLRALDELRLKWVSKRG